MATNGTITITNDLTKANAVTHGGIFHGDDVFATALLSFMLPEVKVARVLKIDAGISPDAIVYDIGMVYDPSQNRYDHHMRTFKETYGDGTKLSSFGLLWKQYGDDILANRGLEEHLIPSAWGIVLNNLILGVDAQDNGQLPQTNPKSMSISNAISQFNTNWDSDYGTNEGFLKAVEFAKIVFNNTLISAVSRARGKSIVENAIYDANDGIMVLPFFVPWQGILSHSNISKAGSILYVVFPSNRGGYSVQGVKVNPNAGNDLRKPLPEAWAGLQGKDLANATGVKDATFCHMGRFICSAASKEGALRLAELAVAN